MADSLYDLAYPPELRNTEERLLGRAPRIGLAVSGGGIRSATFALGVFQALARLDLLRHLDCLSTVSGGSYFGAFFGRLFHRGYIQSHDDIRWVLTGPHNGQQPPRTHDPTLERAGWRVLDWLRENGRYLSPRGAGDLLIGGAVLLRNWVSLHVVLASFFLTMFLLLQLPRMVTFWSGGAAGPLATVANAVDTAMAWMPFASIWWSPWMLVALLAASMAVPPGWAYWIIRDERRFETGALVGAAVAMVFGGVLAIVGWSSSPISRDIGIAIVVFAASTLACYGLAMWRAGQRSQSADASQWQLQRTNAMRHNLSAWFKNVLIAAGIVAAFAIIDSLGQTTYRGFGTGLPAWFTGVGATIIGAAGFARQIVVLISPRANGKRAPLPLAVIATLVAILLAGIILIGVNATSHAIAWDFHQPPAHGPRPRADITVFLIWLLGMTAVILSVGQAFSFLNYSSYQSLYAARLTRAYLGASNEDRWLNQSRPVTEPIPGDDLDVHEYWPLAQASGDTSKSEGLYKRDQKGAPLHFVNVTINETFDAETQVQQQDRKGVGMALGPAGISAGVRHHVVFGRLLESEDGEPPAPEVAHFYPRSPNQFRVFDFEGQPTPIRFPGEQLSLGHWVGISGAAFSTGTGFRTSLGLSLLAGIGNVRLGYWWDSSVDRVRGSGNVWTWLRRLITVQRFIMSELVAHFPGTAHRRWYLSDGGHFENMGGYELIRRQLPLIIVIDAEEDSDYMFEGLANLIRKARLDFDTEITFKLPDGGLAGSPTYQGLFGAKLDDLRPTTGDGAPDSDPAHLRYSKARCALARIQYPDQGKPKQEGQEEEPHWLLYIKPTLTGDEPSDIQQYARAHHPFPHQPTSDQFFDEAQWESYRKLGEHIASAIFNAPPRQPSESSAHGAWTLQNYGLIPRP